MIILANNVSSVNIQCGIDISKVNQCKNIIGNIILRNEESIFNLKCMGRFTCSGSSFIVETLETNYNISLSRSIVSECHGSYSCHDGSITYLNIPKAHVICRDGNACSNLDVTLSSNTNWNGILSVDCLNGDSVCKDISINAISAKSLTIQCRNDTNTCDNMRVYCPMYPFNQFGLYNYGNINTNSCYIDFDNSYYTSNIYAIYGVIQTEIINIISEHYLYCDFNLFGNHLWILNDNDWHDYYCYNQLSIENNILTKLNNNNTQIILSNPYSSSLDCSINIDECYVFLSQRIVPSNEINCMNSNVCSVIWFV